MDRDDDINTRQSIGGTDPAGHDDSRTAADNQEGSKSLHASGPVCGVGGSSGLPSEALPPEVFYSIKLMTGKDAVGTLSGPGTLGIEKHVNGDEGGGSGGFSDYGSSGGEEKRSAVKTLVEAALSWGRGEAAGRGVGGRDVKGASPKGEQRILIGPLYVRVIDIPFNICFRTQWLKYREQSGLLFTVHAREALS